MRAGKINFHVYLVLLATALSPCTARAAGPHDWWPHDSESRARLCFERLESNGRVNSLASRISFGGSEQTATLGGGDSACVVVFAGPVNFLVSSDDPHGMLANQQRCHSKEIRVNLSPHQTRAFSIRPAQNDSGYLCDWIVQPWRPDALRIAPDAK